MTTIAQAIAPFITEANAAELMAQTDRYLWIEYNIIDQADLPHSEALVGWIEDRLIELAQRLID